MCAPARLASEAAAMKKKTDGKSSVTEKIARFLAEQQPETPCLVVDLDVVAEAYKLLRHYLPLAKVFYAVKANPAPRDRRRCCAAWARASTWPAAARSISACDLGVDGRPHLLRQHHQERARHRLCLRARRAALRLRQRGRAGEARPRRRRARASSAASWSRATGAEWPLSRKFGCSPEMAVELLRQAKAAGLDPYGVSFHVGSQQTKLDQWDSAIGRAAHDVLAAGRDRHQPAHGQYRRRLPGALSRRRARRRALCQRR